MWSIRLFILFWFASDAYEGIGQSLNNKNVLLYTRNGKGYIHDNIPNAVHLFDSLSKVLRFNLTKSADASIFNRASLSKFQLIVFASTNNDVFDQDEERLAFRHYIEAGGIFFGIHSVTGTERKWTWFKQMVGSTFSWHPKFQSFDLVKIKATHPTMSQLPARWSKQDECYFNKEFYPGIEVVLAADLLSFQTDSNELKRIELQKGTFGRYYPISWEQRFDGGQIYVTALGHSKTDYQSGQFVDYLKSTLQYLLKENKRLDYKKAYATTIDEPAKLLR